MPDKDATEIEVEVVEIDGVAPVVAREDRAEEAPRHDWRQWQGRVSRLDARWWPLWVLLGIIAVVLCLTLGLVIAAVYVVVRIFRKIVRAVVR